MTAICELRMPYNYVIMDSNEMEYVDGGASPYTWYVGYISATACTAVYYGTKSIAKVAQEFCSYYGLSAVGSVISTLTGVVMSKWKTAGNGNGLNVYGMCNSTTWDFMGYYTTLR